MFGSCCRRLSSESHPQRVDLAPTPIAPSKESSVTANWMKPRYCPAIALCALLAGCGGGGKGSAAGPPGEAQSAATGDIPDNQAFLTFADGPAGYSIRYPEGWTRRGSTGDVTFQDRANLIHVTVAAGPPPTPADA